MDIERIRRTGPHVIVVDGLIAAGKSNLIHRCLGPRLRALGYSVVEILEPIEEWQRSGLLQLFYSDPSRYGFEFQAFVFHSRVRKCQEAMVEGTDFYILERSVFTDRIFMTMLLESGKIQQHEYDTYMDLWTMRRENMPFGVDMFIYLRPSLEETMRRLHIRNRSEEQSVSEHYQIDLLKKHDEFLNGEFIRTDDTSLADIVNTPILHIDTNDDFITSPQVQNQITQQVLRKIDEIAKKCEDDRYKLAMPTQIAAAILIPLMIYIVYMIAFTISGFLGCD